MSFCPTNDIHSLYIDGEMPVHYIEEYEAHIKNCEKCRAKLNKLKGVHEVLKADSEQITPSKEMLDESYKRLMVKMNYSKNTRASRDKFSSNFKYVIPVAAAAAILAVVLPVRSFNNTPIINIEDELAQASQVATVVNQINPPPVSNVSLKNEHGVVISGNIHEAVIPVKASVSEESNTSFLRQKISDKKNKDKKDLITEYEVFRPAFSEDKTISIRITVPGMDTVPITTEIELPVDVLTGYSE